MLKISNNIAPSIIHFLFTRSHHSFNVCLKCNFAVPGVLTVHNGQNSIQYYGSLACNMRSDYIEDSATSDIFKNKI